MKIETALIEKQILPEKKLLLEEMKNADKTTFKRTVLEDGVLDWNVKIKPKTISKLENTVSKTTNDELKDIIIGFKSEINTKLDKHILEFNLFKQETNAKFDKVDAKFDILFSLPTIAKELKK